MPERATAQARAGSRLAAAARNMRSLAGRCEDRPVDVTLMLIDVLWWLRR